MNVFIETSMISSDEKVNVSKDVGQKQWFPKVAQGGGRDPGPHFCNDTGGA